jgi:hypothetical protein
MHKISKKFISSFLTLVSLSEVTKMQTKIGETKNGAVMLASGRFFLLCGKYKIKKGENKNKPLYVVRLSELVQDRNNPDVAVFSEVKSFLLSTQQFDEWLTRLISLSEVKVTDDEDSKQKHF